MKILICILSLFFLFGCGYKPSAHLAKNVVGESVYVYVAMSRDDPQNSVLIKDAIASAFVDRFGSNIVSQDIADTKLYAALETVNFTPLAYDKNGYVISYRAIARLKIDYSFKTGEQGTVVTSGEYDFPIAADSIISDTKRFEAIRFASVDAIDEFTTIIAVKGLKQERKSE